MALPILEQVRQINSQHPRARFTRYWTDVWDAHPRSRALGEVLVDRRSQSDLAPEVNEGGDGWVRFDDRDYLILRQPTVERTWLLAWSEEALRVQLERGLDVGADDYLVKPFSREELLARVRALLRRTARPGASLECVAFGEVRIDFAQRRAWRGTEPVALTAKEFEILRLLLERPGEVISRERFLDAVWGYTAFPTTRTVDRHIATLRTKLGDDAEQPRWIRTVHRGGYRFEGSIIREPEHLGGLSD